MRATFYGRHRLTKGPCYVTVWVPVARNKAIKSRFTAKQYLEQGRRRFSLVVGPNRKLILQSRQPSGGCVEPPCPSQWVTVANLRCAQWLLWLRLGEITCEPLGIRLPVSQSVLPWVLSGCILVHLFYPSDGLKKKKKAWWRSSNTNNNVRFHWVVAVWPIAMHFNTLRF